MQIPRSRWVPILLAALASLVTATLGAAPAPDTRSLDPGPFPVANPLKGFLRYAPDEATQGGPLSDAANDLPLSMEWFYLPLNAVVVAEKTYDWTPLETRLNAVASRGHQAVFRFYVDYPDLEPGIPDYLLHAGLLTHPYSYFGNGTNHRSLAPDWNDPRLVRALTDFIGALGQRYDGDPRVGFLTAGLVGFWGEWHTWPQDGWTEFGPDYSGSEHRVGEDKVDHLTDWGMSEANKNLLLGAFDRAFDRTPVQVRTPVGDSPRLNLGFHDDSFAWETLDQDLDPATGQSWMFWGTMKEAGATESWKSQPMGGEVRPEIQMTMWNQDPPKYRANDSSLDTEGQDYRTCARTTHPTWLLMHEPFVTALSPQAASRIREASSQMGYVLRATKVTLTSPSARQGLGVDLTMVNLGLAPFYAAWSTELALQDGKGRVVQTWKPGWTWQGILPLGFGGVEKTLHFRTEAPSGIRAGTYTLTLRTVNPLQALQPGALPVLFANRDQKSDGWLVLGPVTVAP